MFSSLGEIYHKFQDEEYNDALDLFMLLVALLDMYAMYVIVENITDLCIDDSAIYAEHNKCSHKRIIPPVISDAPNAFPPTL